MTVIQTKLMNAYATLVMANRMTLEEVPETEVTLKDNSTSTLRQETNVEIARRKVEILS
ncbi:CD1375 family protein [Abyssisolibacter fermentans]|uniref:CD1375 family protein n=1 Tax=Abyssisolibacter fermentans TaxID=1766203 RepID=UPI0012E332BB|nr:CD1375 family protein [Abyssisolibacter fermentans]